MFALRASALSADFSVCFTCLTTAWIAQLAKLLLLLLLTVKKEKLHQAHVIDMLLSFLSPWIMHGGIQIHHFLSCIFQSFAWNT